MPFLLTFLTLNIIIFIHELGHMWVAKRCGIGVFEFSLGMGPKIWSKPWRGTEYSLRVLPLGGFVRLAGMDEDEDVGEVPDEINYHKKPILHRMAVILAGSVANIILGFLVFTLLALSTGIPQMSARINDVLPDTPAFNVGFQKNDKIISVEGKEIKDVKRDVILQIRESGATPMSFKVEREGEIVSFLVTPKLTDGAPQIGVVFASEMVKGNPISAVFHGVSATVTVVAGVFKSLEMLFTGAVGVKELSGPLGIMQLASISLEQGVGQFLNIMAFISISLGVFNLLPFPVLDGGHMVFLTIEALRGKPVSEKWQMYFSYAGIAFLLGVTALVLVNDIINWDARIEVFRSLLK